MGTRVGKAILYLVGGVMVTVLGAIAVEMLWDRPDIERETARLFIKSYYADVVAEDTRQEAWDDALSDDFKADDDRATYEAFHNRLNAVTVDEVASGDDDGDFDVALMFDWKDGNPTSDRFEFSLICVNNISKWLPFVSCKATDLQIDDTRPL